MDYKSAQKDPDLAAKLKNGLQRVGHPLASVKIEECEGFALCRVDGLELEPEQMATLARCLKLIGYSNNKLFRTLGAIEEYAK